MLQDTRVAVDKTWRRLLKETRFVRNWAASPLRTGAVAPSSPKLAARMASYIPRQLDGPVLELGPGTGAVTKEILHRVPREKLMCLEYSTDFCNHLRVNFAGLKVVQGDAYNMDKAIPGLRPDSLSAIVSSLPLVTRPPKERLKCLELAFELLKPGAPFIQFSYSLASPVPLDMEGMKWQRSGWILQNIPPARVWVYRKP